MTGRAEFASKSTEPAQLVFHGRWQSIPELFKQGKLTIRTQVETDEVVSKFKPGEWENIFSDISDDFRLYEFLNNNRLTSRGYLLFDNEEKESFGWIYLRRTDPIICDSVEFHGGAWRNSIRYSVLKFTAACIVINRLLNLGIRVKSRCYRNNEAALKFLQSIGFRVSSGVTNCPWYYLTLSHARFVKSSLAKRVFLDKYDYIKEN